MATLQGIQVRIVSLDKELGMVLSAPQPFSDFLELARTGEVDAAHSGFPCGSFSGQIRPIVEQSKIHQVQKINVKDLPGACPRSTSS